MGHEAPPIEKKETFASRYLTVKIDVSIISERDRRFFTHQLQLDYTGLEKAKDLFAFI